MAAANFPRSHIKLPPRTWVLLLQARHALAGVVPALLVAAPHCTGHGKAAGA